jgi:hypothetical protein
MKSLIDTLEPQALLTYCLNLALLLAMHGKVTAYHHSIPNKQNIPPVCTAVQNFIKLTKLQIFVFYFLFLQVKLQISGSFF